jgi:hypothetical protein
MPSTVMQTLTYPETTKDACASLAGRHAGASMPAPTAPQVPHPAYCLLLEKEKVQQTALAVGLKSRELAR